tara:strand:+ start:1125 stop:1616 length:492 start_codon:yes stop_codon:yes gene_type:complete
LNRPEHRYNPLDFEPDVAIGIGLPMTTANGGKYPSPQSASLETADQEIGSSKFTGGVFNSTYTTNEQVQANIRNLVLTNPGERFYHPNFGIGLQGLLFENLTPSVITEIHEAIFTQVSVWLPYVTVKAVDINTERIDNNEIRIKLDYIIFDNEVDLQTVVVFA